MGIPDPDAVRVLCPYHVPGLVIGVLLQATLRCPDRSDPAPGVVRIAGLIPAAVLHPHSHAPCIVSEGLRRPALLQAGCRGDLHHSLLDAVPAPDLHAVAVPVPCQAPLPVIAAGPPCPLCHRRLSDRSERNLRKAKSRQKMLGGFWKESGHKMYCNILSIVEMLKRRNMKVVENIKKLFMGKHRLSS